MNFGWFLLVSYQQHFEEWSSVLYSNLTASLPSHPLPILSSVTRHFEGTAGKLRKTKNKQEPRGSTRKREISASPKDLNAVFSRHKPS